VAHSYGSFISEILASEDKRVQGLVLVDANIPSFFDDKEATVIKARYELLADDLKRDKPDVARVLIPLVQAYPDTACHMRDIHIPLDHISRTYLGGGTGRACSNAPRAL
jgi:pimeloyl-ACP methyl ester carboxylesterase